MKPGAPSRRSWIIMTILNALEADHDEAKGQLTTILATKDDKKRKELCEELKAKLTAPSSSRTVIGLVPRSF